MNERRVEDGSGGYDNKTAFYIAAACIGLLIAIRVGFRGRVY